MDPAADAGQRAVIGERRPQQFRDGGAIGPVQTPDALPIRSLSKAPS
jgi:hypothetical protein